MTNLHTLTRSAAVAALLATVGCENLAWQNPNVPQEKWAEDRSTCVVAAYNETSGDRDRADQLEQDSQNERSVADAMRQQAQRAREIADRREQSVFERCMAEKGYTFTTTG